MLDDPSLELIIDIDSRTVGCLAAGIDETFPLDDFTPLVGQNNGGKSTILEALKWLLKPEARAASDFADAGMPIV